MLHDNKWIESADASWIFHFWGLNNCLCKCYMVMYELRMLADNEYSIIERLLMWMLHGNVQFESAGE
jgi:hypothetical protein